MTPNITRVALPHTALLKRYQALERGYTDCYTTSVTVDCRLAEYLTAFYSSLVFKLERGLIGIFAGMPASDDDLAMLASGKVDTFSAWRVESREQDQIILADVSGRTRSWFMIEATGDETTLYFGSAVLPGADGEPPPLVYRSLLGFHKLYSRILLASAVTNL